MARTRQPQVAVRLRPEIGFDYFWLPSVGVDLLRSLKPEFANNTSIQARVNGQAYRLNGLSANTTFAANSQTILPTGAVSIVLSGKGDTSYDFGILATTSLNQRCGGHVPIPGDKVYWDYGGATEGSTRLSVAGLSYSEFDTFIFTAGPRGMEIWQNGRLCASNAASPTRADVASPWGIGANSNNPAGTSQYASIYAVGLARRQISREWCERISRNVWDGAFAPSRRVWVQLGPAAGGGAVTGTASITQSPQTLTGTGTVAVAGTINKTPAAQTATTASAVAIAGTLNKTQAAQTVTTAGSVAVSGTFNKTPAAQTLTATGTVASGVTGTASITPAAQTVTGSGAVPIAATATITPSAQTATTSGAVQVAATATITPAAQTLAATGAVVSGVVGNATITPAAQTATASGTVPIAATATVTPAPQTLSSTAAVSGGAVTGTANIYVSAQTLVAAANIIVLGTATITPAPQTLLGLEAGTLPAEIPESSRTLSQMTERLGSEWVDTDPARLGLATARRSRPRLG
jgi:hypothetical protein